MDNKLVSIISPCYNGENYLQRFIESILSQTYNNIEFIFVNDGSTDNTEKIILSYKKRFEEKNIAFKYIWQENAGQAAALNRGLKEFSGEYLIWPDSDDVLAPENIEKKVEFLEKNAEYGFVMCKTQCVYEEDESYGEVLFRTVSGEDDFFTDIIMEKNIYFPPGGYMARASALKDVNPELDIFISRAGQNWQMFLPLSAKYKCGYIDEILFYYYVRKDSHSHAKKTYEQIIQKTYDHEEILLNTINRINNIDQEYFNRLVLCKYAKKRFEVAFYYGQKEELRKSYKQICKLKDNELKIRGKYYFSKCGGVYKLFLRKRRRK